ncbi:MAG: transposase [Lachnospiraceae bacterium]|nr:transposase [Lachnospiraceae bacterium]
MEHVKKEQTGHSILRYRVRLYDRHFDWLKITRQLYQNTVQHFFHVLESEKELLELSNFLLLRALEERCIGTKQMKAEGQSPSYPLPVTPKIPLYFRRSAINTAIDLARKQAESMEPHMVFYKGMYRSFTDTSIELKLYNGEKWVWVTYPFTGRTFPEEAVRLSPMLVLDKKTAWLEVPLSFEVKDIRTVRERMQTEKQICAVAFPDNDTLAVAVLLERNGKEINHHFFRGGREREEQRRRLLERIQKSEESRGMEGQPGARKENTKAYRSLQEINSHYAHVISRQILNFCLEHEIKVIVVPNYETSIDFRDKKYLKTNAYRWLGRAIIKNLKYKAFQKGIVVTSVRPYHISDCCSECGARIRRYNEGHTAGQKYVGGKLFQCPNGHKGNTAHNTARNVGKSFLRFYPEEAGNESSSCRDTAQD